jgi:Mce-associated membrane protein
VTSDARAIPREEEDAVPSATSLSKTESVEQRASNSGTAGSDAPGPTPTRTRPSLPLVPVLAVLLVLLLAGAGFLWFTRPEPSSVRTDDYVDVLQAARSGVVDMTSFDYLTLDDDIQQIRSVATGDLEKEAADQLDSRRQQITDSQATVNTEVVGAGVTRADSDDATVVLVIQSTQKSTASEQAQVVRYRIRVDLTNEDGRWLLSGISGTEAGGNG